MAECQELEVPEAKDSGVVEAMKMLNKQLRTDQMKVYLQEAGEFLYIATLATAKDAEQQIKTQNCLFNAVKLCDAWNLMLTNFKVGANDILEKFHIAYLKLLDGFPDFALEDVQSVSRHITSMKTACKKAEGSFTKVTGELKDTKRFLEREEERLAEDAERNCKGYKTTLLKLRKHLETKLRSMTKPDYSVVFATDIDLRSLGLERIDPRDRSHDADRKLKDCRLAVKALEEALTRFKNASDFLQGIEGLVLNWYTECKEVVEKNMKTNLQQADKLSGQRQKDFYRMLLETAYGYLCRWKALHQICLSTSALMRRVRGEIDFFYTENLYPAEAVKKSWELKVKHEVLKEIEQGTSDNVVEDRDRIPLFRSVQNIGEMGKGPLDDRFQCGLYKSKLSSLGSYLWTILSMNIDDQNQTLKGLFQGAKKLTNELCSDLLVLANDCRIQTAGDLAHWYVICLGILDDMPGVAPQARKDMRTDRLVGNVKNLNGMNWGKATPVLSGLEADWWLDIKVAIEDEAETKYTRIIEKENSDDSSAATTAKNVMRGITDFFGKHTGAGKAVTSAMRKTQAVDNVKASNLVAHIIPKIKEQLPLDIERYYSDAIKNVNGLYSEMQAGLGRFDGAMPSTHGADRNEGWQKEMFSILQKYMVAHSVSMLQVDNVNAIIQRGRINEHNIDKNWPALKEIVRPLMSGETHAIEEKVNSHAAEIVREAEERWLDHLNEIREERRRRQEEAAERQRQLEAERKEAERQRQLEAARKEAERQRQLEAERKEAERQRKLEAERKEADRQRQLEAERKEAERQRQLEAERKEAERQIQLEAERKEAERQRQLEAERKEAERQRQLEAERTDADTIEMENGEEFVVVELPEQPKENEAPTRDEEDMDFGQNDDPEGNGPGEVSETSGCPGDDAGKNQITKHHEHGGTGTEQTSDTTHTERTEESEQMEVVGAADGDGTTPGGEEEEEEGCGESKQGTIPEAKVPSERGSERNEKDSRDGRIPEMRERIPAPYGSGQSQSKSDAVTVMIEGNQTSAGDRERRDKEDAEKAPIPEMRRREIGNAGGGEKDGAQTAPIPEMRRREAKNSGGGENWPNDAKTGDRRDRETDNAIAWGEKDDAKTGPIPEMRRREADNTGWGEKGEAETGDPRDRETDNAGAGGEKDDANTGPIPEMLRRKTGKDSRY